MKPATYKETVAIVKAFAAGSLKEFLRPLGIEYSAALMRLVRFRRKYPKIYKKLYKVTSG